MRIIFFRNKKFCSSYMFVSAIQRISTFPGFRPKYFCDISLLPLPRYEMNRYFGTSHGRQLMDNYGRILCSRGCGRDILRLCRLYFRSICFRYNLGLIEFLHSTSNWRRRRFVWIKNNIRCRAWSYPTRIPC